MLESKLFGWGLSQGQGRATSRLKGPKKKLLVHVPQQKLNPATLKVPDTNKVDVTRRRKITT